MFVQTCADLCMHRTHRNKWEEAVPIVCDLLIGVVLITIGAIGVATLTSPGLICASVGFLGAGAVFSINFVLIIFVRAVKKPSVTLRIF